MNIYACPACDSEIDTEPTLYVYACPDCQARWYLDVDADFHDGSWHDRSRLIPIREGQTIISAVQEAAIKEGP